VPGFLLAPLIGGTADSWGRALPIGLGLSAFAAVLFVLGFPLFRAPLITMVLSLGYDMTRPLLQESSPCSAESVLGRR